MEDCCRDVQAIPVPHGGRDGAVEGAPGVVEAAVLDDR
jgi:hypothetical protein